ncbi:nuclear transport factor 2 family protein, partial [Burkholderia cepacia]|uniref:nuclear transport factor 2 family protein n=1 Tax=Burkholderia cepacia TaxID=292 RepID=UPI001E333DF4
MDAIRTVIEPSEAALRAAMLANDVEALEALLDDDLVFTVPTGQVISKEDDLAAHRENLLRLDTLEVQDDLRWNFVANQAVSLASILSESSQAR